VTRIPSGRPRLWPATLLTGPMRAASAYQRGCSWWWT